ncbi:MAG: hypothetical protein HC904_15185 [Blastochloris sp.]|nr:hypothetical protein [Blastochloris sp.]
MTPDLQAALLCEDVRIEASGSNTLVGVLHAIATPVLPVRVMKLCVFTRWCSGQGDFTQSTRILSEDEGSELGHTKTRFKLRDSDNHATNVAVFGGLEFSSEGDYPIEILLDGDLKLRFNLRVVQIQTPANN